MNQIELITPRLKLRLTQITDLVPIHALHLLPATDEFNTLGIPENIEQTKAIIEEWILENNRAEIKKYTFTIVELTTGEFIGLIALNLGKEKFRNAEVWYKLMPDFWRQGLATEILNKILEFGFEQLKLHRIEAGCAVQNIGSARVLEKVGMIKEGRKRKVLPLKTGWSDNFMFAILEEDYLKI